MFQFKKHHISKVRAGVHGDSGRFLIINTQSRDAWVTRKDVAYSAIVVSVA